MGKNVKTKGEFAPAKHQLFSPAFFHESRDIDRYGRSSGLFTVDRPSHHAFGVTVVRSSNNSRETANGKREI